MTKTFDEILSDLLTKLTEKTPFTNLNPSAAIRGILEAVAIAVSGLYQLVKSVSSALFIQTAEGGWLDLKAREVGVKRLAGQKTRIWIIFSRSTPAPSDIVIAAGTCVRSRKDAIGKSYRFFTEEEVTIQTGQTEIQGVAEAESIGKDYNVGAGTVTVAVTSLSGVEDITNEDWGGKSYLVQEGSDQESDRAFRERAITKWDTLGVGGNRNAYYNWAVSVDGVKAAMVLDDSPYGPGTVGIVILGEAGQPTPQLLQDVKDYITPRKPVTSVVEVTGAEITQVNLNLTVTRFANADETAVGTAVAQALQDYGDALQLGEKIVMARLYSTVMAVDGVYNVSFSSPQSDVSAAPAEYLNIDAIFLSHAVKRRAYHDSMIEGSGGETIGDIDPINQDEWDF